jgi:hypothetical protein
MFLSNAKAFSLKYFIRHLNKRQQIVWSCHWIEFCQSVSVHFQYSIAAGIQYLVQQRAAKLTYNQLQTYDMRKPIRILYLAAVHMDARVWKLQV